jgi:carboxypeptidase Taq
VSAYARLEERARRIADLEGAAGILYWDQAVMMPKGAVGGRAEQLATLRSLIHELATAPEVGELLEAAADEPLDDWQAANLREMRRQHLRRTAVPAELVAAQTRAASHAEMVWREAREAGDFETFRPHLQELVRLARESAAALAEALGVAPYDALLEGYQPGVDSAAIDRLLAPLAETLPGLLERVLERQAGSPPPLVPRGPFPQAMQERLARELLEALGFDLDRGRLDVSTHPFCGGAADDVRITTRWEETSFVQPLMAVLHEGGHALYEQGLPESWRRQPVGRARGMAAHESQSLIIEMQASRSHAFLGHLAERLARAFGPDPALTGDNLHRLYTRVERGLIRVEADEVTYPLHIVLRYRLERALIDGDLAVAELPGAWNDGMRELLGVVPASHREGVLQDIHWSVGAFGYFPSYTLGALLAAQLHDAADAAIPDLPVRFAEGDFRPLVAWLRTNVHAHASSLSFDELVTRATGRPLEAGPFLAHLERRYHS